MLSCLLLLLVCQLGVRASSDVIDQQSLCAIALRSSVEKRALKLEIGMLSHAGLMWAYPTSHANKIIKDTVRGWTDQRRQFYRLSDSPVYGIVAEAAFGASLQKVDSAGYSRSASMQLFSEWRDMFLRNLCSLAFLHRDSSMPTGPYFGLPDAFADKILPGWCLPADTLGFLKAFTISPIGTRLNPTGVFSNILSFQEEGVMAGMSVRVFMHFLRHKMHVGEMTGQWERCEDLITLHGCIVAAATVQWHLRTQEAFFPVVPATASVSEAMATFDKYMRIFHPGSNLLAHLNLLAIAAGYGLHDVQSGNLECFRLYRHVLHDVLPLVPTRLPVHRALIDGNDMMMFFSYKQRA